WGPSSRRPRCNTTTTSTTSSCGTCSRQRESRLPPAWKGAPLGAPILVVIVILTSVRPEGPAVPEYCNPKGTILRRDLSRDVFSPMPQNPFPNRLVLQSSCRTRREISLDEGLYPWD